MAEKAKKTTTKTTPKKEVKKASSTPKKKEASTKTTKKAPAKKATATKTVKKETKVVQEENNYTRTLIAAVLIAIIVLGGYFAVRIKENGSLTGKDNYVATADEKTFKESYEGLNGTTDANGQKITDIEIIVDNNIEYISLDKALSILDSGTGVIYFGYSACSYCRNAVPVLLDAMTSSELDKIYYVDIRPDNKAENDIRDTYSLNSKNKAKKTKDASDTYYEVLTSLANHLDDYVLYTEKGKKVNTGEKRLLAPTVVSVVKGEIVGFHQGTLDSHEADEKGNLKDLTKEQKKELLKKYTKVISEYLTKK